VAGDLDIDGPGIYRIRNAINGKCYVGSAVVLAERLYNHRWHLDRGTHRNAKLQNAWRKHGCDAFVFEVLESVLDPARLVEREQHWIDALRSHPEGYNLNPTAGSNLGRTFGEEMRRRVSAGARRAMNDPEVRERHAVAVRAAMDDPEVKRRTAEAALKRWADPEYRKKQAELRRADGFEERRIEALRAAMRARWEALGRTRKKKRERTYRVTAPDGSQSVVSCLKQFCFEAGIPYPSALNVIRGRVKAARGYAFEKIGGDLL
jgi:group I intron endonuclease